MTTRSDYQEEVRERRPLLSDRQFNFLRRLVELFLPACGAFYYTLAEIWSLAYAGEVVGTIAAVTTLLGVLLVVLRSNYDKSDTKYDGDLVIEETADPEEPNLMRLEVDTPLDMIPGQPELRLKVKPQG